MAHDCKKDNPITCLMCVAKAECSCSACESYFCRKHSKQTEHECQNCCKCAEEMVDEETITLRSTLASCDCFGVFCENHIDKGTHNCSKRKATAGASFKTLKQSSTAIVEISAPDVSNRESRTYCFECGYDVHMGGVCPIMLHGAECDDYTHKMKGAKSHFEKCHTKVGGKEAYGSDTNFAS